MSPRRPKGVLLGSMTRRDPERGVTRRRAARSRRIAPAHAAPNAGRLAGDAATRWATRPGSSMHDSLALVGINRAALELLGLNEADSARP